MDAKLQTAVSVGLENSIISVQRFEDLMVPRFCWLLFLLQESWRGQKKKESRNQSKILSNNEMFVFVMHLEKHKRSSSFDLGM
jgi:hypothetical protein